MNPLAVEVPAWPVALLAAAALAAWAWGRRRPDLGALAAVAHSFAERARLYGDSNVDRKKYAEMWFDIYRHDLVFRIGGTRARREAVGTLARDFSEWVDAHFFEYVETIRGKFSRKGFLYPMVLDDFQQLWCELTTVVAVAERSKLRGLDLGGLRDALTGVDDVVRRAGSGSGVRDVEVDLAIERVKAAARDFRDHFAPPPLTLPVVPAIEPATPPETPATPFEGSEDPFLAMVELQRRQRSNGAAGD